MTTLDISEVQPTQQAATTLIDRHFALMRTLSPEESCHVMTAQDLVEEGVSLLGAHLNSELVGIGGLMRLGERHGELKSMHTHSAARGKGVARAILRALIDKARAEGLTQLSLETGSADAFAPARQLYLSEGFAFCEPFGTYEHDPLSVFMTRSISPIESTPAF